MNTPHRRPVGRRAALITGLAGGLLATVAGRVRAATDARATVPATVRDCGAPATVSASGTSLVEVASDVALDAAATGWRYDAANKFLWVKLAAGGTTTVTST